MGSSGSGDGSKNTDIDASVGALVWVRRRNGSWWPGRIMGIDELSENCLVSPRSGTPVKLLGREDASVDWYNLEKSKRVKSFRCGEYDECIEKAKTSAANSSKKTVKYARREDAILHALELESAREGKEPLNLCTRTEKSGGDTDGSARDSPLSHTSDDSEEVADDASDSRKTSSSMPELSQSGISFEEPNHDNTFKVSVQGRRRKTPNDSEDDGCEGVKRMRGLEDLGMGVGSKTKVHASGAPELGQQSSAAPYKSNTSMHMANGITVNGESYPSTLKRKRTQVAKIHEFLKKKNRRRPLTKVLESTKMVSVPVICNQLPGTSGEPLCGSSDGRLSGLECNGSKRVATKMISNSSGGNKVSENTYANGCDSSNLSDKTKENETANIAKLEENGPSDKLYDVPFVGDLDQEKRSTGLSPAFGICSACNPQADATDLQPTLGNKGEAQILGGPKEFGSTCCGHRGEKSTSKWQSKGKRNSRHTKSRKQVSRKHVDMVGEETLNVVQKVDCNGTSLASDNRILQKSRSVSEVQEVFHDLRKQKRGTVSEMMRFTDASVTPQRSLPYRQSRFTVNSRYQMADFPGRNACSDSGLYDIKLEVKASYRPQHVPLVSLMSKLNGKAIVGHPLTIEVLSDGHCEKLWGSSEQDLEVDLEQAPSSKTLQSRVSPRKSKVKKSLLYKKTRTLSSLTGHKQSDEDRKPLVEKLKGPVIACIPLKVVFSRINEAVNGLTRATHRVAPATNL